MAWPTLAVRSVVCAALALLVSPRVGRADGTDNLMVAEREDHSPVLVADPAGHPELIWIATAPDTNAAGRFDQIAVSRHDGTAWAAPEIVAGPGNYYTPSLAFASDGARWACWADHDGTDSQIFLRRDLGGSSQVWELGDPARPDLEPALCANASGGVIVTWQGWRSDNYEILLSSFDGTGFSAETVISTCPNSDREPAIAWGQGKAWIVWSSYQNEPYNLILRTFDGTTLSAPQSMTTSYRARNLHPAIAWDDTNGLLWISDIVVNQGWNGFNNNEPGLYDMGSPRIRAFDGTTLFQPVGVDSSGRPPLSTMQSLGYETYYFGTVPMPDRWGTGTQVVPAPGGRVWVFHKQWGPLTEFGSTNRYWGIVGTRFDGGAWSPPNEFFEPRTTLGWEAPTAVVIGDKLWVAWSADNRNPRMNGVTFNLFGHDLNIVVRSTTVDTTAVPTPSLIPLGYPPAPANCVVASRPPFTIQDNGTPLTLLFGDNHRHSADLSWDAYSDPMYQQTIFYSLDWLGHDFIAPSDHAERYSKAIWAWIPKWAMIYDIPGRYHVFAGYERAMRGYAGGDQNTMYRDPADFREATAAYPAVASWHTMYAAMSGIDVLAVPHTPAECGAIHKWNLLANGDPRHLAPPLRLVEVYQSARESFEYPGCPLQFTGCVAPPDSGWVSLALAQGMRVGLIAASDHTIRAGFISVFAEARTRDAIWNAMAARRTYGSSRATKFNCEFRVNGSVMGTEIQSSDPPELYVHVEGPNNLLKIEINKDGNPTWYTANVSGTSATVTTTDPATVVPGTSSFYYARVSDANNKMLWTSPVWVDFTEPVGTSAPVVLSGPKRLHVLPRPNPSHGAMAFSVTGLDGAPARLRVYDVNGRLVRAFDLAAGARETVVPWDGRDGDGNVTASGAYFARLQAMGQTESVNFVRVKPRRRRRTKVRELAHAAARRSRAA